MMRIFLVFCKHKKVSVAHLYFLFFPYNTVKCVYFHKYLVTERCFIKHKKQSKQRMKEPIFYISSIFFYNMFLFICQALQRLCSLLLKVFKKNKR